MVAAELLHFTCLKAIMASIVLIRRITTTIIVREQAILLIKWLRPKGLKRCSYVEKYAELKNQTIKKSVGTQKCYARRNTRGVGNFSN